jgi:zeaxanthin glucosyltransferase
MARVLIHMLREHGHLLPTVRLAHALAREGHVVEHLLTPSWRGFARTHGLRLRPYLEHAYPEGSETAWERMGAAERTADFEARLRLRTTWLLAGELVREYERARPDLVLGDVFDVSIPLAAHRAGVKLVQLSTSVYQGREPGVPPITSSLAWGTDAGSRRAADDAWARLFAERRARAGNDWYLDYVQQLVDAHAFPPDHITWDGAVAPDFPALSQLVLCPSAFEFPRSLPARCSYDVPSLETRPERLDHDTLAWLGDAPLVYCAFGTQAKWRPGYRRLYDEVLAAAHRRPALRWLVATGAAWRAAYAAIAPPNVRVVAHAPQHAVLERAQLMIAVGGLGSIKECVWLGVPMVLLPSGEGYDPPGNAARAAYHGLARVLDPERSDADALARAVDAGLAGEQAAAVQRMRAAFVAAERSSRGIEHVERALAGRA